MLKTQVKTHIYVTGLNYRVKRIRYSYSAHQIKLHGFFFFNKTVGVFILNTKKLYTYSPLTDELCANIIYNISVPSLCLKRNRRLRVGIYKYCNTVVTFNAKFCSFSKVVCFFLFRKCTY